LLTRCLPSAEAGSLLCAKARAGFSELSQKQNMSAPSIINALGRLAERGVCAGKAGGPSGKAPLEKCAQNAAYAEGGGCAEDIYGVVELIKTLSD
jgi:hypothetical protein